MNQADKTEIISRYEKRLKEFGHDVRTLASGDDTKQLKRYRALQEVGIGQGNTVLDVGCGFGDFLDFLHNIGLEVDYTGYDIVPGLVDIARNRHPNATFELRDIQENPPARIFDWIVSSQAFNNRLKYEDNVELVRDVISVALNHCNKGIAIDMMGDYVDYREDRLYYFNPEAMFSFCKGLAKRVTLRHDYLPFEFCLYVFKDSTP